MGDRGGEVLGRMRSFFRGSPGESPKYMSSPSSAPSVSSSNVSAGPARAIRLVYTDEKGRFCMDPEAVALLQLVKEPVGVVSVCGRARQGKSFILNQLLGRSSGFQVAPTHRPCTKGLWLWSSPITRTALDGTEYKLLLLDSEGIDAYDQTGTYSTQIFSLAVLLSSMFIYNQMGGIDEASLDRLSLVTEMTKHIRVRASGGRSTASELGQFSPIFVWLLRDFYLDLEEDNRKITPRDYLELALRPVHGGGRDVASKNEIRDSIRALFPDRECYSLVRPLSNENDLQRLDQIPLEKLRPEFKSGLDALTKFVFERARPKQMGATMMTGPFLARITQSFLDALNNGAVPTITSSWQSVEEAECQRAYELGSEAYISSFDRSKPPEEAVLREAHEDAVQKSMALLMDIKKDHFAEARLKCTNTIENMGRELRLACHAPDAKIDTVIKVLDELLLKYDSSCQGPEKWHKAFLFLQQSLEGPILDFIKRQIDQMGTEKNSIALKCRLSEDKIALLNKQLEASEKYKSEYIKRFEDATNEKKKLADGYMSHIANLQNKYSPLEEKVSNLSKVLDTAKQESLEWKRKYELGLSKQKAEEEQFSAEVRMLRSRASAAEARLAASQEKAKSALEDVEEWKRKYEFAARELKNALENANSIQERLSYQSQSKEAALRAEFAGSLAQKDAEIAEKAATFEQVEERLTILSLEMKAADSKIKSYDLETSNLKSEIKNLVEKVERSSAAAVSAENKVRIIEQEKAHLEQTYQGQFNRFSELQERCKVAEKEAKRATELADEARAEASSAQKEKSNLQRVAMERLAQIERAERQAEALERQKVDLMNEIEQHRVSEGDALFKVQMLDQRLREKEQELDSLLQSNSSQRKHTVEILEKLLVSERTAHTNANKRAEELSLQLQATQGQVDELSHELNTLRYGDKTASDGKVRSVLHAKRGRTSDYEIGMDSVHDSDPDARPSRANKKSKSNMGIPEDGVSISRIDGQTDSHLDNLGQYTKLTKDQLKQVLAKNGVGEVWRKNVSKNELLDLVDKYILRK